MAPSLLPFPLWHSSAVQGLSAWIRTQEGTLQQGVKGNSLLWIQCLTQTLSTLYLCHYFMHFIDISGWTFHHSKASETSLFVALGFFFFTLFKKIK